MTRNQAAYSAGRKSSVSAVATISPPMIATAIGPKKSTSVDEVRVGGSSLGGDRVTTVVPPVTNTPGRDETAEDAGEAAGEAGSEAGSADGSSAGSSEGSSN